MRCTAISFFIIMLISPTIYAQDTYTLDIVLTGVAPSTPAEAVLKVFTKVNNVPKTIIIPHKERNSNGHFIKNLNTGFSKHEAEEIYLIGTLNSPGGSILTRIPLQLFGKSDFNLRLKTLEARDIPSFSDKKRAFRNSYPFSESFGRGFINSENIESVLKSSKILIENSFIEGLSWSEFFNAYLQNTYFFKKDNSKIAKMLAFLKSHSTSTEELAFNSFYTEMLVRLDSLDVDGTQIDSNLELRGYIYNEYLALIESHTPSSLPHFRKIIDLMKYELRYAECTTISEHILSSIKLKLSSLTIEINDKKTLAFILSAMQGATECFQLDYAHNSKSDGSNSNRSDAASFQVKGTGYDSVVAYVELFEHIEELDPRLFPRNLKRKYPNNKTYSRVSEIVRYYDVLVGHLEKRG